MNFSCPLHQLNVKNIFLNKYLEEKVFIGIPFGYEDRIDCHKAYRLKKSLYGLKQTPTDGLNTLERL
jgi:hypothetical protein